MDEEERAVCGMACWEREEGGGGDGFFVGIGLVVWMGWWLVG